MTLVIPQTVLQRVVPNDVLGRISSVFLAAEALATLLGALAGPLFAGRLSLFSAAVWACVVTVAGALAGVVVIPMLPKPWRASVSMEGAEP